MPTFPPPTGNPAERPAETLTRFSRAEIMRTLHRASLSGELTHIYARWDDLPGSAWAIADGTALMWGYRRTGIVVLIATLAEACTPDAACRVAARLNAWAAVAAS